MPYTSRSLTRLSRAAKVRLILFPWQPAPESIVRSLHGDADGHHLPRPYTNRNVSYEYGKSWPNLGARGSLCAGTIQIAQSSHPRGHEP
jgi:hypothetical protein